jgi:hypothetical protein
MSKDEVEIPMNRGRSAKSVKSVDTPKAASPKPGSSRTTVYARKSSHPKTSTASTSVARRKSKRILFSEEPEEVVSNKKAKKRGPLACSTFGQEPQSGGESVRLTSIRYVVRSLVTAHCSNPTWLGDTCKGSTG